MCHHAGAAECTKGGRWELGSKPLLEEQSHIGWRIGSLERELGENMEGLRYQTFNSLGNRKTKEASEQSNEIKAIFYEK